MFDRQVSLQLYIGGRSMQMLQCTVSLPTVSGLLTSLTMYMFINQVNYAGISTLKAKCFVKIILASSRFSMFLIQLIRISIL